MYSLLLDTHSEELRVVLFKNGVCVDKSINTYSNQSKYIVLKIKELLTNNSISFNELKEMIVINGPGSFTGVRIGVTIAKTIAYALNIPIKSISSLMLKAININSEKDYSVSIPDNKGYYLGKFDSSNNLLGDYFYLSKDSYEDYKKENIVLDNTAVDWNNIYKYNCLNNEDFYNIKALYIKKIGVEND